MKWLLLVLLVSGCATPLTDEQKVILLLDHYGPRCGYTFAEAKAVLSNAEGERYVECIKLHVTADQARQQSRSNNAFLENLSRGFGDAGYIMGGSSPPPRRRDFMCYSDCSNRRYSASYCETLCSY